MLRATKNAFPVDYLATSVMTHIMSSNWREQLPHTDNNKVMRIIASRTELQQDLIAIKEKYTESRQSQISLQMELREAQTLIERQQDKIWDLELRLHRHCASALEDPSSSDESNHEEQTVYEFLSEAKPGCLRTFPPTQSQKASSPVCLSNSALPSSLLEPPRDLVTASSRGANSKSTGNLALMSPFSRHQSSEPSRSCSSLDLAPLSKEPTARLRESSPGNGTAHFRRCDTSEPQDGAPLADTLTVSQPTLNNPVSSPSSQIPSPVYRVGSQARPRRDRSNSSLTTVRHRSPSTPIALMSRSSFSSGHSTSAETAIRVAGEATRCNSSGD